MTTQFDPNAPAAAGAASFRASLGLPAEVRPAELPQAPEVAAGQKGAMTIEEFEAVGRAGFSVAGLRVREPQEAPGAPRSASRFFDLVQEQDWATSALARLMADYTVFDYDPSWKLPAEDSADWQELTRDIPTEYWENLGSAMSRGHAFVIADRIRTELANEQELAAYGGWGIAGRVVLNMADPAAIALAVGTAGLGTLSKADRLRRAVKASRAAGDFAAARAGIAALRKAGQASTAGRIATVGAIAGAENAALEAMLLAGSETRDAWDVANAALAGVVLGAGASSFFVRSEKRAIMAAFREEQAQLHYAELESVVAARREQLLQEAGDPADLDLARATAAELDRVTAEITSLRESLGRVDENQLDQRLAEVERVFEELHWKRGAGEKSVDDLVAELRAVEKELRGRGRERRALAQEMRYLTARKGMTVAPAEQEAKLLDDIRAELREQDARVYGDQVDAPRVVRKREKEAAAELRRRRALLPSDQPRVARLESRFRDSGTALETLGRRAAELRDALRIEADYVAAGRERDALRRVREQPAAERARLTELEGQAARLEGEKARLGRAGEAARQIDQLDDIAARIRVLIARAEEIGDAPASRATEALQTVNFGSDSGGAARFVGGFEPTADSVVEITSLAPVGRTAFSGAQRAIRTFTGILRGHENEAVRDIAGRYVGDSVGTADGSPVALGASEVTSRLQEAWAARMHSLVDKHYSAWLKASGKNGLFAAWSRESRNEFMNQVGRAIKGEPTEDTHVTGMAQGFSKLYADILREARVAGVEGFEEVAENANYLPRFFDFDRLHKLENEYGTQAVVELVAGSLRSASPDMEPALVSRLANAYVRRLKELRIGVDVRLANGVPIDDLAYLRHILEEAGETPEMIDEIAGKIAAFQRDDGKEGGTVRHARGRLKFDETFRIKLQHDPTRRAGGSRYDVVSIADLFDNNAERVFNRYARSMAGHVGMARAAGVRSLNDHARNVERVRKALEASHPRDIAEVVDAMDDAYKLIVGTPLEKPGRIQEIVRSVTGYNFATSMNQAGFAQIPDLATLLSKGYLRHTLTHSGFSDLFRTIRRGADGRLDDELAREVEETLGLGTDYHNNQVFASYEDVETGLAGAWNTAQHGIRVAGRVTQAISGMGFINSVAQRLAAKVIVQRLTAEALKGGAYSAKRLASLGLDAAMIERIGAQLRKHTAFVDNEVGGKVRAVNWSSWDDVEARDAMLYGVFREARRIVQEEDLGDTGAWMHTWAAKLIMQFRRFAIVSYSRQLLHGLNHADAEQATRVMMSMTLAAGAYTAQMTVKMAALDGEERDEFEARYLAPERIAAAAYARSAYSSLIPAMVDTVSAGVLDVRLFDARTSGQASDLITGNPTFALLNNLGTTLSAPAQALLREDRGITQDDAKAFRRILPFQNALGLDFIVNPTIKALPKSHEDANPDEMDLRAF